jgi:NAD(P)-dependent dehydrogenase (short-subunit alcohol dehydrogenase family)
VTLCPGCRVHSLSHVHRKGMTIDCERQTHLESALMLHQSPAAAIEAHSDLWGPFSVAGRNALVTGAGKGIGRGIADRLAEGGANVLIADIDLAAAQHAAEHMARDAGRPVAMRIDVSNEADCEAAVQRCIEEFGSLDLLVNDAGIFPTSPVLEMSQQFFDRVLGINLRGLVFMSKAAGLQMLKQGVVARSSTSPPLTRCIHLSPAWSRTMPARAPSSASPRASPWRWHHITSPSTRSHLAASPPKAQRNH